MAMTNAERQRNYVARLKSKAEGVSNVTNEIELLRKDKAKLEGEIVHLKEKVNQLVLSVAKLQNRRSALTTAQFNKLAKCIHPDVIKRFNDPRLEKQFTEAFQLLSELR
jgi:chromosome segregation ATPase